MVNLLLRSHLIITCHGRRGADTQQPELREPEQPFDGEVFLIRRHEGELTETGQSSERIKVLGAMEQTPVLDSRRQG